MRKKKVCYFVYIIQACDGTYYTGMTRNIKERLALHASGKGAKYLRGRAPITLVYSERLPDIKSAMVRELQIKKYSKQKKGILARRPSIKKPKDKNEVFKT